MKLETASCAGNKGDASNAMIKLECAVANKAFKKFGV